MKANSKVSVSFEWLAVTVAVIALAAWYVPSAVLLIGFLGVVITTHEAGHYFMAKRAGMKPTEFFWGFGPEIVAFERNGCRYGLKALSLGGYVRLEGMVSSSELPEGIDEADTFRAATPLGRLLTILAGPAVNFVVAIIAFGATEFIRGASLVDSVRFGVEQTWLLIKITLEALWILISQPIDYLSAVFGDIESAPVVFLSPLGQANQTAAFVEQGLNGTLAWLAILSAAIGLVNLLPLPPLDGSHALAAIVDMVSRKFKKQRDYMFDMKKLVPLAYVTIGLLFVLTFTSFIIEIRQYVEGLS